MGGAKCSRNASKGGISIKHYGDITKLSGYELPIVDCIIGGSPCQDLSVAGKRAGLAGERSGLFMEQLRIVKEMRKQDELGNGRSGVLCRPRYMGWENVPGSFSSAGGKDFQAVLSEIVKVVEPDAPDVPLPEKGRWPKSGCIYDEMGRWSVAYRLHDAQFWGVPQRRKRIALVADFGGLSAPEILFERKGVSGDFEPCAAQGQEAPGDPRSCADGASCYGLDHVMLSGGTTYQGRGYYDNVSGCLKTQPHGVCETFSIDKAITTGWNCTAGGDCIHNEYTPALTTDRPHAVCETISFQERAGKPGGWKGILIQNEHVGALSTLNNQAVLDNRCWSIDEKMGQTYVHDNMGNTLSARDYKQPQAVVVEPILRRTGSVVRRLTPMECERLQGFPDHWTDIGEWTDSKGKKHKPADSPRYKALGNSIAVGYANNRSGFWMWMLKRISAQYERSATLGSLFDGIGGFPLAWETFNGKGSAVWASEIEEFCIAVTKKHFPEEDDNAAKGAGPCS